MPGRVGWAWVVAVSLGFAFAALGFWSGGALGAGVGAVAGGFAPLLIERSTRVQEAAEAARRAKAVKRRYRPAHLLDPELGVVPFIGRTAELGMLEGWCLDAEAGLVRLVSGGGGVGKTRLALELMRRMTRRGWRCAVVADGFEPDAVGRLRAAAPRGRLLLVVDYAEARTGLEGLLEAAARDEGRVRVLLVARQAGDWWQRLEGGGALVREVVRDAAVVELAGKLVPGLSEWDEVRRAIPFFAARLRAAPPDPRMMDLAGSDLRVLDVHAAALVAVLAAAGKAAGVPVRIEGKSVLAELLGHEKHYWRGRAAAAGLLDGPSA